MGQGSGDRLARGAARASFQTTAGGVSKTKWDNIFDDFNPEEFQNAPNKSSVRRDADGEATGDASSVTPSTGIRVNRIEKNTDIDGFGN